MHWSILCVSEKQLANSFQSKCSTLQNECITWFYVVLGLDTVSTNQWHPNRAIVIHAQKKPNKFSNLFPIQIMQKLIAFALKMIEALCYLSSKLLIKKCKHLCSYCHKECNECCLPRLATDSLPNCQTLVTTESTHNNNRWIHEKSIEYIPHPFIHPSGIRREHIGQMALAVRNGTYFSELYLQFVKSRHQPINALIWFMSKLKAFKNFI